MSRYEAHTLTDNRYLGGLPVMESFERCFHASEKCMRSAALDYYLRINNIF